MLGVNLCIMLIAESIQEARKRGATDDEILQEIIKQNSLKGNFFSQSLKEGSGSTEILEKLIKQEEEAETNKIEEARKRIAGLQNTEESKNIDQERIQPIGRIQIGGQTGYWAAKQESEQGVREKELPKLSPWPEKDRSGRDSFATSYPVTTKPEKVVRVVSKKPSSKLKLFIRIAIVVIVLVVLSGVATFWYWFFIIREQPPVVKTCFHNTDCPKGQICNSEGSCVINAQEPIKKCSDKADCPTGQTCNSQGACVKLLSVANCFSDSDCLPGQMCNTNKKCVKKLPKPTIPPSLFSVAKEKLLKISSLGEIPSLLSQTLQTQEDKGRFIRLIIENSKNNTVVGLKEFFKALSIKVPDDFYQDLNNDFTLFVYSQDQGNRLGFMAKVNNQSGLKNLLRNQEPKMENEFQPFFVLMGKKKPALVSYFKNASSVRGYTGPNFRYQTINRYDLGILYLTSADYFVFTSSWNSMMGIIKKLGIN